MDQMEFLEKMSDAEGIHRNGLPCGQTPSGIQWGYARSLEKPSKITGPSKLISIPVLGGLYHRYQRVAA
jgi:hypothetical protein